MVTNYSCQHQNICGINLTRLVEALTARKRRLVALFCLELIVRTT